MIMFSTMHCVARTIKLVVALVGLALALGRIVNFNVS